MHNVFGRYGLRLLVVLLLPLIGFAVLVTWGVGENLANRLEHQARKSVEAELAHLGEDFIDLTMVEQYATAVRHLQVFCDSHKEVRTLRVASPIGSTLFQFQRPGTGRVESLTNVLKLSPGEQVRLEMETDLSAVDALVATTRQRVLLALLSLIVPLGIGLWLVIRKLALQPLEQSLQEKEAGYFVTLNSIGDAVLSTNIEGHIDFMNPVAETLTGWSLDEARQRPVSDVFKTVDFATGQPASNPVEKVLATGSAIDLPTRTTLIARDGTERQVADSGAPIRDEDGRVTGVVLVFRDVSEAYAREQQLRDSEERYRAVAEDTPVLICRFLPSGEIVYANESYCRYFDKTPEELIGSSFLSLIPEDNRNTMMAEITALAADSPTQSHEHQVVAPNGEIRWQRWTNRALFDARDQPTAYQSIGEDITERKLTEEALRRNEETYRSFFEQAPLPYQALDENGNVLAANAAWRKTLGYESSEVPGKSFEDFLADGYQDHFRKDFARLAAAGEIHGVQYQMVRKDKQVIDVEFEGKVAQDSGGEFMHAHCLLTDVTERLRHEVFTAHQTRRTEALLELPRAAEEMDEIAFMQRGLKMAEELTESRISFVHFVNDDEQSIELVTWSRRTLEEYCSATGESHYPVREAGIWADALRRSEAVVFNDYPAYAHKRGLPEGHAELTRLISLPVIENGKVVMLAGVGNKFADYTDLDVETLQLIANAIWRIVQRRRGVITLRANEARYRELVESMTDGVAVYEAVESGQDFVIREHNQAGERITGLARDRVIGRRLTEALPTVDALGLLEVFRRVWRTGEAESYPTSQYKDERISVWVESYVFKLPGGEIVHVYSDVTERMQAEEALRASRERLRRLAARIEATREEERTAIAREVHDEFGQALTGLKMDLAWLRDHLAKARTKPFTERLEAAEALADSTLDGMRRLAARLRPSLLDDLGLTAAIEWQVKEFAGRVGWRFDLDLTEDDIGFNRERDTAVYRILQEALTNVARHAQASQVTVSLEAADDALELIVADNGKGIREADMESVTSMGLTGMRERAGALGGHVDIRLRPGGGTRVLLRVPRSGGAR